MDLLIPFFVLALFVILTPGILVKLPPGGSKLTVAVTHALVFAFIYHFTYKIVRRLVNEGFAAKAPELTISNKMFEIQPKLTYDPRTKTWSVPVNSDFSVSVLNIPYNTGLNPNVQPKIKWTRSWTSLPCPDVNSYCFGKAPNKKGNGTITAGVYNTLLSMKLKFV